MLNAEKKRKVFNFDNQTKPDIYRLRTVNPKKGEEMKKFLLMLCIMMIAQISLIAIELDLNDRADSVESDINYDDKTNQSKEIILNFERINAGYNLQKCKESEFSIDFLSDQSPASLLELLYEFAENDNFTDAAMAFIPFMREHFKDTDYQNSILNMIAEKDYNQTFRYFVIDMANSEVTSGAARYDKFQDILCLIPFEKDTAIYLKKFALLGIKSDGIKIHNLLTDLMNEAFEPKMISAIVIAMQRKNHPDLDKWLTTFLSNPSEYDDVIICSAGRNSSKSDIALSYVTKIGHIARTTNSEKMFQSMIYSLGNFRTETAVIEIIEASGRFDYRGIRNALRKSQTAIEKLVQIYQKKENIIYGLQALRLAELPFNEDSINEISRSTNDETLKKECQLTLDILEKNRGSYNYRTLEKIRGE